LVDRQDGRNAVIWGGWPSVKLIYQDWTDEVLAAQPQFAVVSRTKIRPEDWPPTRYEAKAISAGRQPIYWSLRRRR
jgi:hypothetical protein